MEHTTALLGTLHYSYESHILQTTANKQSFSAHSRLLQFTLNTKNILSSSHAQFYNHYSLLFYCFLQNTAIHSILFGTHPACLSLLFKAVSPWLTTTPYLNLPSRNTHHCMHIIPAGQPLPTVWCNSYTCVPSLRVCNIFISLKSAVCV